MESFIMGLIGFILYPLFHVFFLVIDGLQTIFFAMAGVDDVKIKGIATPIVGENAGGDYDTGIVYYILRSDLVHNLFISILILALFLIVIFTAMAFIKNAYASKQKTWQEIVGNAFKGLANFIFLPVCCLLGVWLSNILLVAINGATSTDGAVLMSRKLFICAAYDANDYRYYKRANLTVEDAQKLEDWAKGYGVEIEVEANVGDYEYYANIVDTVYTESPVFMLDYWIVNQQYRPFYINYIMLAICLIFMLTVLISMTFAMIKRLFLITFYFIVSPAICAIYPIDEGKAVGSWKSELIKQVVSAYGAVAGLNLFFALLPMLTNIELFSVGLLNTIFQVFIMVSGLFVVKEFIGTLSGWIGGDNAMTAGKEITSSARKGLGVARDIAVVRTASAFKSMGKAKAKGSAAAASLERREGETNRHFLGRKVGAALGAGAKSMGKDVLDFSKDKFSGLSEKTLGKKGQEAWFKKGDDGKTTFAWQQGTKAAEDDAYKARGKQLKDAAKARIEANMNGKYTEDTILNGVTYHAGDHKRVGRNVLEDYHELNDSQKNARVGATVKDLMNAGYSQEDAIKEVAKMGFGEDRYSLADRFKKFEKQEAKDNAAKDRKAQAKANAKASAAQNAGQASANASMNSIQAATVQLNAAQLDLNAQKGAMQDIASTSGINSYLQNQMQAQIDSGAFAPIVASILGSYTGAELDLVKKWNEQMEKIGDVNKNYADAIKNLISVGETLSTKLKGVDDELNNLKTTVKDANAKVEDLEKGATDLTKAMTDAVKANKEKK